MTYPPTASSEPPKQHVPPVNYYCHNCGKALSNEARFCGRCGTPRQATAVATGPLPALDATTLRTPPHQSTEPGKTARTPMSGALMLLIGLGVVVMLVGVLAVTATLRNAGDDSPEPPAGASLSRNETCAREVVAEALFIYVNNVSFDATSAVWNAIGSRNPQRQLVVDTIALIYSSGTGPATAEKVRAMCTAKSNPILTSAQVDSLMRVSSDFNVLSEITMFS